jgi:hypothetical protein
MIEILSSVDSILASVAAILGSIALITVTIKKKEKMEDGREKNDEPQ